MAEDSVDVAVLVERLAAAGSTVAVAESLTGGLLAAAFVDVPGVSAVFRGGVVAYATDCKHTLLGVDADLLAERGPVDAEVAAAMARGVRERLETTFGLAATGVAGPDPQDGVEPGRVFLAVAGPHEVVGEGLRLSGDRAAVRRGSVVAALALLAAAVTP